MTNAAARATTPSSPASPPTTSPAYGFTNAYASAKSQDSQRSAASNTASAEENVRVSRLHYDAGTETLSDLLEAQTLWQVANRDSVEADINHFLAWLSYLKTTGQICNEFIK